MDTTGYHSASDPSPAEASVTAWRQYDDLCEDAVRVDVMCSTVHICSQQSGLACVLKQIQAAELHAPEAAPSMQHSCSLPGDPVLPRLQAPSCPQQLCLLALLLPQRHLQLLLLTPLVSAAVSPAVAASVTPVPVHCCWQTAEFSALCHHCAVAADTRRLLAVCRQLLHALQRQRRYAADGHLPDGHPCPMNAGLPAAMLLLNADCCGSPASSGPAAGSAVCLSPFFCLLASRLWVR